MKLLISKSLISKCYPKKNTSPCNLLGYM